MNQNFLSIDFKFDNKKIFAPHIAFANLCEYEPTWDQNGTLVGVDFRPCKFFPQGYQSIYTEWEDLKDEIKFELSQEDLNQYIATIFNDLLFKTYLYQDVVFLVENGYLPIDHFSVTDHQIEIYAQIEFLPEQFNNKRSKCFRKTIIGNVILVTEWSSGKQNIEQRSIKKDHLPSNPPVFKRH